MSRTDDMWDYQREVAQLRRVAGLEPRQFSGPAAYAEVMRLRDAFADGRLRIRVAAARQSKRTQSPRQPFRTEGVVRRPMRERSYSPAFLARWGLQEAESQND